MYTINFSSQAYISQYTQNLYNFILSVKDYPQNTVIDIPFEDISVLLRRRS